MNLKKHSEEVNLKLAAIIKHFTGKISKHKSVDLKNICDKINGVSHRLSSFNYHLDLVKREVYDERERILNDFTKREEPFTFEDKKEALNDAMNILMARATFLLRDVLADFFGALDNFAGVIARSDKNASGRRMSDVIHSLDHHHVKDKPFAVYLVNEWNSWINPLYEGYRKDAIHLNPDNCKISYSLQLDAKGSVEEIRISLPDKVHSSLGYGPETDLFGFCLDIQNRLLTIIENVCQKLTE
jgi:hypothetical protein